MGYHSGLNGEYNIPVEVSEKKVHKFKKCCKEELPESALKIETYLKDDIIYFVLPNNYKPVKICFDNTEGEPSAPPQDVICGGKGNKKLNVNVDFTSSDPFSTGYYYKNNDITIGGSGAINPIYSMIDDGVYNPNLKYDAGPADTVRYDTIKYDTINENLNAYEDAIKSLYSEISKALGAYKDCLD